jgi:transposase
MALVSAWRHGGIVASLVLDGPCNGEHLRTWVAQGLIPDLREGDIVVMNNLGSHKAPAIRQATRAAYAQLLYLPAWSPGLNLIAQVIAKLKHHRRKAAERTREAVWRRIGSRLDQCTPEKCENQIRNTGYGWSKLMLLHGHLNRLRAGAGNPERSARTRFPPLHRARRHGPVKKPYSCSRKLSTAAR